MPTQRTSPRRQAETHLVSELRAELAASQAECERAREELALSERKIQHLMKVLTMTSSVVKGGRTNTETESERKTSVVSDPETLLHRLTPKQVAVVTATATGSEQSEIARRMEVTESTVSMHFRAARLKMGIDSRGELLARCLPVIEGMERDEFRRRYAVDKDWIASKKVPQVLLEKRSSLSQHIESNKAPAKRGARKKKV